MAMNLELKKFDMTQIREGNVVALIGRKNTGKSFLCRDILYNHRDIHRGQVISETEEANPFYTKFVLIICIDCQNFSVQIQKQNWLDWARPMMEDIVFP